MTTCPFNNLSSPCTAIFSEGKGQLTHAFITVLVQKTHINPISIAQNEGIIIAKYFITLGKTASLSLSWIRGAGSLFC